jgi:Protein of unknown function (DUF2782)
MFRLVLVTLLALPQAVLAQAASAPARPAPHVTVIEDDNVRIEESRIRGRVQGVTVQPKIANVPAYQVQVAPAGRDPSQEKGNAGRRTWQLLSF